MGARRLTGVAVVSIGCSFVLTACGRSPSTPSNVQSSPVSATPSSQPIAVGTVTPISPADGAQFTILDVPLVISNASITGNSPVVDRFEISTDASFANPGVYFVTQSDAGTTTFTARPATAFGRTFFWRARAQAGEVSGPMSPAQKFSIVPSAPDILPTTSTVFADPPTLLAPIRNGTAIQDVAFYLQMARHAGAPGAEGYDVVVATDYGMSQNVATCSAPDSFSSSAITSCGISNLTPGVHYWHARTVVLYNSGGFPPMRDYYSDWSPVASFVVAPQVIHAPIPLTPASNAYTHARPTFVVQNAAHSGPVGPLTYVFEVDAGGVAVATGLVPEGAGMTQWAAPLDLVADVRYTWTAAATDTASGITGAFSSRSFTVETGRTTIYKLTMQLCFGYSAEFAATTTESVNSSHIVLSVPNSTLTFDLSNAMGALTGAATGSAPVPGIGGNPTLTSDGPIAVSGTISNDGVMAGVLTGIQRVMDYVGSRTCTANGAAWTASPQQ